MDHLPIITELELTITEAPKTALHNFRDIDWDEFKPVLEKHLATTGVTLFSAYYNCMTTD
jgi:hypothetical protein